ncbi:MAG: S-methyl-5-thioribose-1-phosphate isomerase [Gammaproteobacteria bacterium]|nr:S-methyl-5-thioribose-1-phosphate isomerase [Gammaproteobacteria bacterium]
MRSNLRSDVQAIRWDGECLFLLDQRKLPSEETYLRVDTVREAADAIRSMVVRGAPAIGVTAAYAVVLAARARFAENPVTWREAIRDDLEHIAKARPTAVNLRWAIDSMRALIEELGVPEDPVPALLGRARRIQEEDVSGNVTIGRLGAKLIQTGSTVLTHCNAGALATSGYGTALGVVRAGFETGRIARVFADETRPWLQGSRLTAWELSKDRIPVTIIPDAAAAALMRAGEFSWVIVGADRIARNGDVANKIGTYSLAVNARQHGVRFMVAAPINTIDPDTASGADIPIENRDPAEVLSFYGRAIAPPGVNALNPVFDVTPASLVDVLVTDHGVIEKPSEDRIRALLDRVGRN